MKTVIKFMLLLLICSAMWIPVYSQELVPFYLDERYPDNRLVHAIEDADGNIICVGHYGVTAIPTSISQVETTGVVMKITTQGDVLGKKTFEPETAQSYMFSHILENSKGTYTIVGMFEDYNTQENSMLFIEIDDDLNVISERRTKLEGFEDWQIQGYFLSKIDKDSYMVFSSIYLSKEIKNLTFVLQLDGTISDIKTLSRPNDWGLYDNSSAPVTKNGEKYVLFSHYGYVIFDSGFNLISEIFPTYPMYSSDIIYSGDRCQAIYFDDNDILCFSGRRKSDASPSAIDVFTLDISGDKPVTKLHARFGFGRTSATKQYAYPTSQMYFSEMLTNENSILIGGTFGSTGTPWSTVANSIGVSVYNRQDNKIYNEAFYEDGENCYFMMYILPTRDEGAVVVATRATRDKALNLCTDAVLFKYDKPTGVESLSDNSVKISVYPNPATNVFNVDTDAFDSFDVVFYDAVGRETKSISGCVTGQNLDISDLKKGIYMIELYGSNGVVGKQKLVVK